MIRRAGAGNRARGQFAVRIANTQDRVGRAKGVSEEATAVIIRVVNSSGAYQQVRLDGVDPFSKQRAALVATQPLTTQVDLIVSRAPALPNILAAKPSCTEARRWQPIKDPSVTVFYLGVPDTTPEFTTAQAMDEYFAKILGSTKSR